MAKRVGVDKWMFCVTLLLVLIGLAMVFSASAVMAKERFGSPYFFVQRQAAWAIFGLISTVVLMHVDYRRYNKPNVVFPVVAVTVLCLLGAFVMRDSHATHRWI
jgi:cell division protein FtsW